MQRQRNVDNPFQSRVFLSVTSKETLRVLGIILFSVLLLNNLNEVNYFRRNRYTFYVTNYQKPNVLKNCMDGKVEECKMVYK